MNVNAVPSGTPDPSDERAPMAGGGEPPYDGDMDRRLTVLETRFDTILPTLATKADLVALRAELVEMFMRSHNELRLQMETMRAELRLQMETMRAELRLQVDATRLDTHAILINAMKWFIGLAIALAIGMASLTVAVLNGMSGRPAQAPAVTAPSQSLPSPPLANPSSAPR